MSVHSKTQESKQHFDNSKPPVSITAHLVGGKDSFGKIITAIYGSSPTYIVYETDAHIAESCVILLTSENDETNYIEYSKNRQLIKPKLEELKAILYKCSDNQSIKSRRGTLAVLGLHNAQDAINQFDALINSINTDYVENFEKRIFYLGGAFFVLLVFCTLSAVLRIAAVDGRLPNKYKILELLFYVLTSGVIGGFISVSYKIKSIIFERGISKHYFAIYGIERLIISILASIVLFFAIKANFVLGFIEMTPKPFYGYIFLGIIAGFSETLIPDLLIKMEKQSLA